MNKQEFEEQYAVINNESTRLYNELQSKYGDFYLDEKNAEQKFGDDYPLFQKINESYRAGNALFNKFKNQELNNQNLYTVADVDLSVAIEVHDILLEKDFYKEHLDKQEDFDFVKVIYHCLYNDNWNDLLVAKLQLFKGNQLIREIVIFDESLFENDDDLEGEEVYNMKQKFEIEMYQCRAYSNNEAYQSFFIRKEKCNL